MSRNRPSRHLGFTLLEMLLALSLSGVVIVLAGRLAVHAVMTRQTIETQLNAERPALRALDQFRRDWENRFVEEVAVQWDTHHRPMIVMQSLCGFAGEAIHLPVRPAQVVYRLLPASDGSEGLRWVRTVQDLSDELAVPQTTTILNGIQLLEISLHTGHAWQPISQDSNDEIELAALRLHVLTAEMDLTRTFLMNFFRERDDDES